jgi:membrane-associated phospholipid phosphatase
MDVVNELWGWSVGPGREEWMEHQLESSLASVGSAAISEPTRSLAARLPRRPLARLGLASAASFAILLVHALVADPTAIGSFDLRLIQDVQRIRWEPLGRWLNVFEQLTDAPGAIYAWLVAIAAFALLRWWLPALALLSLPLGGLINETISRGIVGRHRPHLEILRHTSENPNEGSFPSGHVVGAVLLYGFVWYVVGRRVRFAPLRWLLRLACLAVILLTGFDRVWDGAHWPTDVLAGYALGLALLAALALLCEWVEQTAAWVLDDRHARKSARRPSVVGWIDDVASAMLGAVLARYRWLAIRLAAPAPETPSTPW